MRVHRCIVFFLLLLLLLVSCVPGNLGEARNLEIENNPSSIQFFIEPGDKVKIITKDYEKISFVVVEVTDEAIMGESEKVLFTNISKIQKEIVSGTENFWRNIGFGFSDIYINF